MAEPPRRAIFRIATRSGCDAPAGVAHLAEGPSGHRHAAVDVQCLPGDVTRLAAGEIDASCADVLTAAHLPDRNAGENAFALLLIQSVRHRRCHEAWCNRVDRDAAAGELLSHGLGHPD